MTRQIPALREVNPKFAEICDRIDRLQEELSALDVERAALARSMAAIQQSADESKLSALVSGVEMPPRTPASTRFGEVEERRRLLRQAIDILVNQRADEHRNASSLVCDRFANERDALRVRMFESLAAAVVARAEIGRLQRDIERSGAYAGGYDADLFELFGGAALARNSDVAIELRRAVKKGYIREDALPREIR